MTQAAVTHLLPRRFFKYPLDPLDALRNLGAREVVACAFSYLRALYEPPKELHTFEDWVVSSFGWRFYQIFFKTYTEKVWPITPL